MPKWLKILSIIIIVFIGLILLGYWKFAGFTKSQKYNRCVEFCEKNMTNASNVEPCKLRCEEITKYSPNDKASPKSTNATTSSPRAVNTNTTKEITSVNDAIKGDYSCEWSWPQAIIQKSDRSVIKTCTSALPYCKYGVLEEKDLACCATGIKNDDGTMEYTGCEKIN